MKTSTPRVARNLSKHRDLSRHLRGGLCCFVAIALSTSIGLFSPKEAYAQHYQWNVPGGQTSIYVGNRYPRSAPTTQYNLRKLSRDLARIDYAVSEFRSRVPGLSGKIYKNRYRKGVSKRLRYQVAKFAKQVNELSHRIHNGRLTRQEALGRLRQLQKRDEHVRREMQKNGFSRYYDTRDWYRITSMLTSAHRTYAYQSPRYYPRKHRNHGPTHSGYYYPKFRYLW